MSTDSTPTDHPPADGTPADGTPTDSSSPSGFPRWLKWGLLGSLGVLVVGYGLIFLYAKVINDSPDEFDESTLDSVLAIDGSDDGGGETAAEPAPADEVEDPTDTRPTPPTEPAPDQPAVPGTEPPPAASGPSTDGVSVWEVTAESELGYRVKEILFGVDTDAVGRTNQIIGSIAISGTTLTDAEFIVDVASIGSDDRRRDGQFNGRIMSTDEFPTATFTLTEPIELGTEPGDGAEITTTAIGELTLRGVTNAVTFELTAKQEGQRIGVLGQIPVVFADYGIGNPSVPGITTEDHGLLEFVLVFEPG